MSDTPNELHNNDRKVLAEHFRGKPLSEKAVSEFCTNHKIAMTDAGSVEDFIYQQDYDNRMKIINPLILEVLATYQTSAEYDTEEEQKAVLDHNNSLAEKISRVLEENGVLFREMDCLQSLAGDLGQLIKNAEGLSSRMCANVMAEMTQEKLGNPLTIKALAGERAQIADRKFKKEEAEKPAEEKPEEAKA